MARLQKSSKVFVYFGDKIDGDIAKDPCYICLKPISDTENRLKIGCLITTTKHSSRTATINWATLCFFCMVKIKEMFENPNHVDKVRTDGNATQSS